MSCLGEKRSGGGWVGGDLGRIGGTGSLVLQYRKKSGMTDAEDYLLGGSDTHTPLMTTIREAMSAVT